MFWGANKIKKYNNIINLYDVFGRVTTEQKDTNKQFEEEQIEFLKQYLKIKGVTSSSDFHKKYSKKNNYKKTGGNNKII